VSFSVGESSLAPELLTSSGTQVLSWAVSVIFFDVVSRRGISTIGKGVKEEEEERRGNAKQI
jgi:hypothetical protein